MKRLSISMLIAASLLTACVVAPAGPRHHGEGVVLVPVLPSVVVLGAEPYYFYKGYHYHYDRDRWFYSKSKNGPWFDLPRDHYPHEVRHERKEERREHERDRHHREDERRNWD